MEDEKFVLSVDKVQKLNSILESLTHSGSRTLDKTELGEFFQICDDGKGYVYHSFKEVMKTLEENHSEVRYSAAQLCDELFKKYEDYRIYFLGRIHQFFTLTVGLRQSKDLPPPISAANAMKTIALHNFLQWHNTFSKKHLILKRAYRYLEDVEHVDFRTLEIVDPLERRKREEREKKDLILNKERLKIMNRDMDDIMPEIRDTLSSIESCFQLLMPSPAKMEGIMESKDDIYGYSEDMRLYGILNPRQSLHIELYDIVTIVEDDENSAVLEATKDAFTLINNRFLSKVKAWIEIINKGNGGGDLMKRSLELKAELEAALCKYGRLNIVYKKVKKNEEEEMSTDSDFEEVPPYKPTSKETMACEIQFLSSAILGETKKLNVKRKQQQESFEPTPGPSGITINERKKKLLEVAPKLPFDIDLYHWEDEQLFTPTMLAVNSEGSRFWGGVASEDLTEIPIPDGTASLRTRVIEYVDEWKPVNHVCKAPLPSGNLCPRRDRIKCPFHGLIVDRDHRGHVVNPADEIKVAKSKSKQDIPDWQDPKLLAEIKAQTGIDLKMPEKGRKGKKKKKKHPGLTDIKEINNTPTSRISKKIFNKKSLKRVAEQLDKLDHRKHRDKFGDQFNYV